MKYYEVLIGKTEVGYFGPSAHLHSIKAENINQAIEFAKKFSLENYPWTPPTEIPVVYAKLVHID